MRVLECKFSDIKQDKQVPAASAFRKREGRAATNRPVSSYRNRSFVPSVVRLKDLSFYRFFHLKDFLFYRFSLLFLQQGIADTKKRLIAFCSKESPCGRLPKHPAARRIPAKIN